MELEEAKKYLEIMIKTFDTKCPNVNVRNVNCLKVEAIETVLQALDNSIPKEKVKKIEKYCKSKSTFQTFGDEQLKRAIEIYVNKTKNDILNLLEE